VDNIPPWVIVAALVGGGWLLLRGRRTAGVAAPNAPIQPGHNPQSGDRTVQNPKVVPWVG
jgi:hypothetical protein